MNTNSYIAKAELIARLEALGNHSAPHKLDASKEAIWRQVCIQAAWALSDKSSGPNCSEWLQELTEAWRKWCKGEITDFQFTQHAAKVVHEQLRSTATKEQG